MLEAAFWLGAGLIAYVYAGYPLLLALAGAVCRRPEPSVGTDLPTVSIIVAAHNEEGNIAARLDNLLSHDYAADRREIIVVDDGSTDATAAIVRGYAASRVLLLAQRPQQGKTAAQNAAVAAATGDILVFTDANGEFAPGALLALTGWFADPRVGGVCGALHYLPAGGRAAGFGERLYWRYERLLKILENASGSLVGMNGAIYALPRRLYEPLPALAQSDLVIALRLRARGLRVVYEPDAVCVEPVYERAAVSFSVKRRTVARAMAAVLAEFYRLRLIGQPWFALKLLSHKVLRWLLPWVLLLTVLFAGMLGSAGGPSPWHEYYRLANAAGLAFLGLAALGWLLDLRGVRLRLLALPYYFCLVNFAALIAALDVLAGNQQVSWRPRR